MLRFSFSLIRYFHFHPYNILNYFLPSLATFLLLSTSDNILSIISHTYIEIHRP